MRKGVGAGGVHDGQAVGKVGVEADGAVDECQGLVVPLDVDILKVGVGACTEEMSLGVSIALVEAVTEMTKVCLVVPGCSAIWTFDGVSAGSCPERVESDLQNITNSCRHPGGEPEMVAG